VETAVQRFWEGVWPMRPISLASKKGGRSWLVPRVGWTVRSTLELTKGRQSLMLSIQQ
jgi:hypothetical protein